MSITFSVAGAGWERVPCTWCETCSFRESGEGFVGGCDGYESRALAPEANFANGNARVILSLLGYEPEDYGTFEHADLPAVARRIMRLRSQPSRRAYAIRPASASGGPGTGQCRMIDCGTTDEAVSHRLEVLADVVAAAQQAGKDVTWG